MTREHAIETILALYPADAEYTDTAKIGQELLERAKREVAGWRTEPTEVLIRYAQLCESRDNQNQREFERKCKREGLSF